MPWRRNLTKALAPTRSWATALMLAIIPAWGAEAAGHDIGARSPGQFDYYVLSLTWVPGFCSLHRTPIAECERGLGFALHGLWPQLNGGDYPTYCSTITLSADDITRYGGLYADPSLIAHEWPKHGTCSGLAPAAYFALSASDETQVKIPAAYSPGAVVTTMNASAVVAAFIAANQGLTSGGLRAVSVNGSITEVDICLTQSGAFRSC